jgi:hypothetical protein
VGILWSLRQHRWEVPFNGFLKSWNLYTLELSLHWDQWAILSFNLGYGLGQRYPIPSEFCILAIKKLSRMDDPAESPVLPRLHWRLYASGKVLKQVKIQLTNIHFPTLLYTWECFISWSTSFNYLGESPNSSWLQCCDEVCDGGVWCDSLNAFRTSIWSFLAYMWWWVSTSPNRTLVLNWPTTFECEFVQQLPMWPYCGKGNYK